MHSYISGNTVYQALDESQIGWHTANPDGNTNYYGIEVCQSIGASDSQFLANEQAAFQEAARLLTKWGLPANRNTVRLHREFSQTICPHRSTELHAGVDPQYHAVSEKQLLQVKDYFIQQIRAYMDGKVPTSTVSKNSPSSSNTVKPVASSWKVNAYGTYYQAEHATFTVGSQPIAVHAVGPFVSTQITGWLQPGQSITYDEKQAQDGHIWVSYTGYNGQELFLPVRTWSGNNPDTNKGELWGTIS